MLAKLDEENMRSRKFLNPTSFIKVTREVESRLIADHLQFLHAECKDMVTEENRKGGREWVGVYRSQWAGWVSSGWGCIGVSEGKVGVGTCGSGWGAGRVGLGRWGGRGVGE